MVKFLAGWTLFLICVGAWRTTYMYPDISRWYYAGDVIFPILGVLGGYYLARLFTTAG